MFAMLKRVLVWLATAYVAGQVIEIDGEVYPIIRPEII